MITINLSFGEWPQVFGDAKMTTWLLDCGPLLNHGEEGMRSETLRAPGLCTAHSSPCRLCASLNSDGKLFSKRRIPFGPGRFGRPVHAGTPRAR